MLRKIVQEPRKEEELVMCLGCDEQLKKSIAREIGVGKYFHGEKCFLLSLTKTENRPALAW
jgi:hypothetical protein